MKLFLAAGMNANVHSSDEMTALDAAAKCGDLVSVRTLLDAGAEIRHGDSPKSVTVSAAVSNGHTEIAQLLLDRLTASLPSKEPEFVRDAFFSAAARRQHETAIALLARLKRVDNKEAFSAAVTAALFAVSTTGSASFAEQLLDQGASVNEKGPQGDTPLLLAARSGHLEVVKALLKRGADINILSKEGVSACRLAFANDHSEVGDFLYEKMGKPGNYFDNFDPLPQHQGSTP